MQCPAALRCLLALFWVCRVALEPWSAVSQCYTVRLQASSADVSTQCLPRLPRHRLNLGSYLNPDFLSLSVSPTLLL